MRIRIRNIIFTDPQHWLISLQIYSKIYLMHTDFHKIIQCKGLLQQKQEKIIDTFRDLFISKSDPHRNDAICRNVNKRNIACCKSGVVDPHCIHLMRIRIQLRIRIQDVEDQKSSRAKKIQLYLIKNFNLFNTRTTKYCTQERISSISTCTFLHFVLFIIFPLLDPDPEDQNHCGSVRTRIHNTE